MNLLKEATIHNTWFIIMSFISVMMLIISWLLPPTGVVDPSVLQANAEIMGWGALWTAWKAIVHDKKASSKVGNVEVKIE